MVKVVCVDNSNWPDYLTVGKEYEAKDIDGGRYHLVEDDNGCSHHYHISYFKECNQYG